jgi:hypothetical protein
MPDNRYMTDAEVQHYGRPLAGPFIRTYRPSELSDLALALSWSVSDWHPKPRRRLPRRVTRYLAKQRRKRS